MFTLCKWVRLRKKTALVWVSVRVVSTLDFAWLLAVVTFQLSAFVRHVDSSQKVEKIPSSQRDFTS